jgi:hypothetical protein
MHAGHGVDEKGQAEKKDKLTRLYERFSADQ